MCGRFTTLVPCSDSSDSMLDLPYLEGFNEKAQEPLWLANARGRNAYYSSIQRRMGVLDLQVQIPPDISSLPMLMRWRNRPHRLPTTVSDLLSLCFDPCIRQEKQKIKEIREAFECQHLNTVSFRFGLNACMDAVATFGTSEAVDVPSCFDECQQYSKESFLFFMIVYPVPVNVVFSLLGERIIGNEGRQIRKLVVEYYNSETVTCYRLMSNLNPAVKAACCAWPQGGETPPKWVWTHSPSPVLPFSSKPTLPAVLGPTRVLLCCSRVILVINVDQQKIEHQFTLPCTANDYSLRRVKPKNPYAEVYTISQQSCMCRHFDICIGNDSLHVTNLSYTHEKEINCWPMTISRRDNLLLIAVTSKSLQLVFEEKGSVCSASVKTREPREIVATVLSGALHDTYTLHGPCMGSSVPTLYFVQANGAHVLSRVTSDADIEMPCASMYPWLNGAATEQEQPPRRKYMSIMNGRKSLGHRLRHLRSNILTDGRILVVTPDRTDDQTLLLTTWLPGAQQAPTMSIKVSDSVRHSVGSDSVVPIQLCSTEVDVKVCHHMLNTHTNMLIPVVIEIIVQYVCVPADALGSALPSYSDLVPDVTWDFE